MRKLNTKEFIIKANKIHNCRYDYSKTKYQSSNEKIIIICPIHGEFLQIPDNHLHRKSGCPTCGVSVRKQNIPKTKEQFVIDSKKIHGNKYDYSKIVYKTSHDKVNIICKIHGEFQQKPNGHLSGDGCPKCGNRTRTTKQFIEDVRKIHGNKYDYKNVVYVNLTTKIEIGCDLHGTFSQTPNAHLKGQGCPLCKTSKGERLIKEFLDKKKFDFETQKTFPSCLNPKTNFHLYYDFFVKSKNILIEFDGYQHFKPYYRDRLNLDSLNERKYRDDFKTKWAKINGYKLLRIKYTEIKNIQKILTEQL